MFSWIIKMLLKFMKPLVKFAIISGLLSSILGGDETSEPAEEENGEAASEG